jgi:hypothetical protein
MTGEAVFCNHCLQYILNYLTDPLFDSGKRTGRRAASLPVLKSSSSFQSILDQFFWYKRILQIFHQHYPSRES